MATALAIPGVTKGQYDETTGEAGLRPFPYVSGRWTAQTAEVVGLEIFEGEATDYLVIKGKNGEYGVRISVPLDPTFIPADYGNKDKQIEKNVNKLLKVLKAFDLATIRGDGVLLEPSRFAGAIGKVFSFSIQGAMVGNMPKFTDRGYQRLNVSFKGAVPELLPVTIPPFASESSVNGCALNSTTVTASDDDAVIPF
jgi:hypothetical protein